MANEFSKEERVAFDNVIQGFEDALVASKNVTTFGTEGQLMERANDTIWRPQQIISVGQDRIVGSAITAKGKTQLAVPATIGYQPNDAFDLSALELRDQLREGRLGDASKNYLASRINTDVLSIATLQGTITVTRTTAAGDYDDVAAIDSVLNEQGVPGDNRFLMLNSRDYNGMAGDLAARQTMTGLPEGAYRDSYVGRVASFETFKLDSGRRIAATTASGLTMSTLVGGANYYVPVATRVAATGERSNVDNRYQTITVSAVTNINVGDCFTVDGLESVHHINKTATGQAKTFRVISIPSSTTLVISPPMITNQGGSDAEEQYQNCSAVTTSATAALTFMNVDATGYNPFWRKSAIELLPGSYQVEGGQGAAVMRATTENGIEIVMTKRFDPDTFLTRFTFDCRYGVVMVAPEQAGNLLFSQVP